MRTVFAYSLAIYSALIFAGIWGMPDGTASDHAPVQREVEVVLPCPGRVTHEGVGAIHEVDRPVRKSQPPATMLLPR